MADFEFLIVGAGTAGARLATRLALQNPQLKSGSIGLIESGDSFQPLASRIPAWYPWCFGSQVDWSWVTEPQTELQNRRLRWPRGRLLGGSGAINALIDIQASHADWNRWGWSWAKEINTFDLRPVPETQQSPHPWNQSFLAACQQFGLVKQEPLRQSASNICGNFMVARRNGQRIHTGELVESLDSVKLLGGLSVRSLLFDGHRAIGAEAVQRSGVNDLSDQSQQITARHIILCAGTLGSPELLLRSGIGPKDELIGLGIDCRVDLPGVGKNLQDHLVMPIVFKAKQPQGLPRRHDYKSRRQFREFGTGSLASNIAEATALIGGAEVECAEFQIHFTANHYWKYPFREDYRSYLSLNISDLHPHSRGSVGLNRKPNKRDFQLAIDPGYLTSDLDRARFVVAYSIANSIASQSSLAELIQEPLTPEGADSGAMVELVRKFAQSIYHPIGTCPMQSSLANYEPVVDQNFNVFGTENLWIADASILPDQPSCNPNRTVILIADRMAKRFS